MANNGPESTRSNQDLRDDNIKRMLRLSVRHDEKLSPYEASLMLDYITERGKVTAEARESIKEIAKTFPIEQYEGYLNAKLKDMKEKETSVNNDILDDETIEALRKIAASGVATTVSATAAPTSAAPAPAPTASTQTGFGKKTADSDVYVFNSSEEIWSDEGRRKVRANQDAYYATLSREEKKAVSAQFDESLKSIYDERVAPYPDLKAEWDKQQRAIDAAWTGKTKVVVLPPLSEPVTRDRVREERFFAYWWYRVGKTKKTEDTAPAAPAKAATDGDIVWDKPGTKSSTKDAAPKPEPSDFAKKLDAAIDAYYAKLPAAKQKKWDAKRKALAESDRAETHVVVADQDGNPVIVSRESRKKAWDELQEKASKKLASQVEDGLENLSDEGRKAIAEYAKLPNPKALAFAEDGAVGYASGTSAEWARAEALKACSANSKETPYIVSVDGQSVVSGTKLDEMVRTAAAEAPAQQAKETTTTSVVADSASEKYAEEDLSKVSKDNNALRAYIAGIPSTAPAEARDFAKRVTPLIGKGKTATPNEDVRDLQKTLGIEADGAWGKNTRWNVARALQASLRAKAIEVKTVVAGPAAPTVAATEPAKAEKPGKGVGRKREESAETAERYVPISEASAVEMPDVKMKEGKISFEDLDNKSFRAFVGDKSLADLKGIYESFYQGDFKKTAAYLEEKYGIEDAGMFITYRTQMRSFELALLTCIREMESGIPEYASMLFRLADFNENNKVSEDDTISRSTENLLFARFVSMSPAQVRAMLLSAGVSVEDYQRDAAKTAKAFRNYYQAAGTAGVPGAAIERGRVADFASIERDMRTKLVDLYNQNKPEIERVAAENANMRQILEHLPSNISRDSFLQGIFLEYAGVVFGANTAGTAKFNIESLGVFFDSLVVGATDKHFGVGVSKSWNLNNSGSVRAETGVMNFLPFGLVQADAYKSDPEIRDFYSQKLEGQTRISPFAAASIFDAGVGTSIMWNEKNPVIERKTVEFRDTLIKLTNQMKDGKEPDLSGLVETDRKDFAELLGTIKHLNEQMGGESYERIVYAASMVYKAELAEKHSGIRLAGVNVGFSLGTHLVAGLVGGPIGSLAAALVGMLNIERTSVSYSTDEKSFSQGAEYDLSKAPRTIRLFNRRAVVDADGNKTPALALNKNEVTAIDTPTDGKTQVYEVRDGYLVTGPGVADVSIVNFDRDGRRSKIMTFGQPKNENGTLIYRPYSPAKLPKGWTTEAMEAPVETKAETDKLAAVEKGVHDRLNEAMNDENVKRVSKALEGFNTKADSFDLELATLFRQGAFGDKKSFDAAWARFVKLVDTDARWSMVKAVKADIDAVAGKGDDYKRVVMSDIFSHFMRTRSDVDKIGVPTEQHEAAVAKLVTSLGADLVAKLDARLAKDPNTALDSMAGIPKAKQADARNYLRLKLPMSVYDTTLGTLSKADDRQEAFAKRMAEAGISRAEADRVQAEFNKLAGKATYTGRENLVVTDGFVLPISSRVNPVFRGLTPMMAPITLATVDGKTVDIPMESTAELRKAVVAMFPPDLIDQLAKALKTDAASVRKAMEDGSNGLLSFEASYTKWGACANGGIRISKLSLGGQKIVISATEGWVTSANTPDIIGAMYGLGAMIDSTGAVNGGKKTQAITTPNAGTGTGGLANGPAV